MSYIKNSPRAFSPLSFVALLGLLILMCGVLSSGCTKGKAPNGVEPPGNKESLEAGENAFTLDLYKRFGKKKGNLFFSPISISAALAMTYAGAAGTTAAEMHKALRLTVDRSKVPATFHAMMKKNNPTKKKAGFELSMANRVYIKKGYGLKPRFKRTLQQYYAADAEEVDFEKSQATAKKINGWVAKETKGRIKDLVPAQALTALTRLVLANAIYFKGDWKMAFNKKATRPREFYLDGGKRVSVDTMHQEAKLRYLASNNVQVLEMPYTGDTLSMVVVLPKKKDGLDALEKRLTAAKLRGWLSKARERKVKIYLPKFKLKWGGNINGDLIALGMRAAFSPDTADFRHINPTAKAEELYISHVFHKAFVEVNEKGTEAAAATAVVMETRGMAKHAKPTTPVFRADHPFMFLIRNKKSGAILFAGRLADPR